MSEPAVALRARLARPEIVVAPGVYDALGALLAERAGFDAVFVSGSALAAAHLGRPDVGLLTLPEIATIVGRIADRVAIPLLVDADQGGGNAFAVARNVRLLEKAGAAAIQIEDQAEVKPARDPLSRPLVDVATMIDKIHAAKDACHGDTLISARSDAASSEGVDAAIERASAYVAAGADIVFAESLAARADVERLVTAIDGRAFQLHNLLRPGEDIADAASLEELGFSIALFPAPVLAGAGEGIAEALANLVATGRIDPARTAPPIDGAAWLAASREKGPKS